MVHCLRNDYSTQGHSHPEYSLTSHSHSSYYSASNPPPSTQWNPDERAAFLFMLKSCHHIGPYQTVYDLSTRAMCELLASRVQS
jgi:hypothetical protein